MSHPPAPSPPPPAAAPAGSPAPSAAAAGRLYGVGVGPGDPELLTIKARRVIEAAQVIAYPAAPHGRSVARRTAAPFLRADATEVALTYPVTTETTDHPGGYEAALHEFYDESAATLAAHLDAGRDVAVLCAGDPFLYGSYMYLHERLAASYETEVIPGVTSFSAAAAATGTPLAKRDDVLAILPGTLAPDILAEHLRTTDAAVVLKLGRTFDAVRDAAERAGVAARGVYVERASSPEQRTAPLRDVDGQVPYMSLLLVPTVGVPAPVAVQTVGVSAPVAASTVGVPAPVAVSPIDMADSVPVRPGGVAGRVPMPEPAGGVPGPAPPFAVGHPDREASAPARDGHRGRVAVVGLGPAGAEWLTPEAQAELAAADDLVGYETYLARVPVRRGQRRHPSDNRVEARRARHALELAAGGARVAVVSSGDPGIFAMAAAVFEQVEADGANGLSGVEVRVVPGLSAMQAAAARVGAPLGHDFCVISLSDQLKPWSVVDRRLRAAGAADLVLALYNPASRTRREQLRRAFEILRAHRAPATPVVVARAVGSGSDETITVTTLADVRLEDVDMRTLLIVGSSTTRVTAGGAVYTPRRYPG
jgi:precorrin-2 C20-methyltransferase/precorrin-3B C17-methyltransferase